MNFPMAPNGYVPDSIVIGDLALEIARRIWFPHVYDLLCDARLKDDFASDRHEGDFVEKVKAIVIEELQRRFA